MPKGKGNEGINRRGIAKLLVLFFFDTRGRFLLHPVADSGSFSGDLYIVRDIPVEAVVVTEGSLLVVNPDHKLTSSARFAIIIGAPRF